MCRRKGNKIPDNVKKGPPPVDPNKQYVNIGEEDQMVIEGFRSSGLYRILTWIVIVLTVGLLRLVFHWKPEWMLYFTHEKCPLDCAEKVLLKDQYEQYFVENVIVTTRDGTRVKIMRSKAHCCPQYFNSDVETQSQITILSKQYSNGKFMNNSKLQRHLQEPESTTESGPTEPFIISHHHRRSDDFYDQPFHHLHHLRLPQNDDSLISYFMNKKLKYTWNSSENRFEKLKGLEDNRNCYYFHENSDGLSQWEQQKRLLMYGGNSIDVKITPIIKLLFKDILNPFYIFQIFSIILWYCDEYEAYATCIVLISIISISTGIYQTRKMQHALKNTIQSSSIVTVLRSAEYMDIPSDMLVPGDLIVIPRDGCVMHCDAVLISGNCIVNESMLTGESVPVTKTPLPNPNIRNVDTHLKFNMKEHSKHVLFCGTKVIQTRYYGSEKVKAVVLRTGFMTAKGELVRSILYPKPCDFRFNQDTYKFVGFLACIASMGFLFTIIIMSIQGETIGHMILRGLDLVTITVAPALPAALTVGTVFAQRRLTMQNVFCISPSSINVCGTINCVCFDKTGTLTEDGLDMYGAVQTDDKARFKELLEDCTLLPKGAFLSVMATCHSLTIIDDVLSGDPLDLKMFEATQWEFEEIREDSTKFDVIMPSVVRPKKPDIISSSESIDSMGIPSVGMHEIGIIRQFTFSSSLQRMSVITRTLGENCFTLYAKGSPEMIASLSKPETVPSDFHNVLTNYTQQGYRVIALAWKPLKLSYVKVQRIERKDVEKDLIFLGLIIMVNKLKPESKPVINTLTKAGIRSVMVTGDNILTALSVARDCHIVEPGDKVILVNAKPAVQGQPADVEWVYAEDNITVEELKGTHKKSSLVQYESKHDHYHFALTGKSWDVIKDNFADMLPKLVVRGTIFARMSPDQKAQLIESLQELGYYVGMCGDGANDCGALKTAHAGISLSEAEASVASPFTSTEANINCVPTVIKEGRASLVTSFGIFKYIACYSLTQFVTVLILYWIGANLTDFEFLYIDLILLTSLSITFGRTAAYPFLSREPPLVSLFSSAPIISLIIQVSVQLLFQVITYYFVLAQPWYVPFVRNAEEEYASHENFSLFCVSSFQYITLAIVFSKGTPYRKSILTNYWFLANLVILIAFTAYLTIYPAEFFMSFIELLPPKSIEFRLLLVGISAANFLASLILESFLVDNVRLRRKWRETKEQCLPDTMVKHKVIEKEIKSEPDWPPISESVLSLAELTKNEFLPAIAPSQSTVVDIPSPEQQQHTLANGYAKNGALKNSIKLSDAAPSFDYKGELQPSSPRDTDALILKIETLSTTDDDAAPRDQQPRLQDSTQL
ncbi:polyamine-transporting ATPase 13A3-like [Tubulanus polymorphus]|uniref:polyamine-transporting ATPase 13A3-like n=1 Tax=Tubulanus polymorphus TaxID=672921 RepID=UPI003DA59007